MRIKVQPAVDTDAMARAQASLDRAKAETYSEMKELKARRAALGSRKHTGRVGAIHYDALVHAMEQQGKDILTKAGDDYWNWEKRHNPWMCEEGCVPGTDSVNGHGNRFGRAREKYVGGTWYHWDAKVGGWIAGEAFGRKGVLR